MEELKPTIPHTHNGSDSPQLVSSDSIIYDVQTALTISDSTLSNAVTRIGEIEVALQNLGLLN